MGSVYFAVVYRLAAALLWHAATIRSGEGHKGDSSVSWPNHVGSLNSPFWGSLIFSLESYSYDA